MGRRKLDEGKRVALSARVSEGLAADVDLVRGELTRSAFVESAVRSAVARALMGPGQEARRKRHAAGPEPAALEPPAARRFPPAAPIRQRCPHPGLPRTAGGYCKGCDMILDPGGYLPQ